ncbi:MAG: T9SS type A sorting domain-containing protein [Ferruginibacter sp.]
MEKLYPSSDLITFRCVACQVIAVVTAFLLPCLLHAQISGVSLSSYQACGGATIVPFCTYSTQAFTPVTIYYEKMVTASVWQLEGTQVYNNKTSYIVYNGDDLITATNFRVRAIDGITGIEYISNSTTVNPAAWNFGRGTALSIPTAYWGTACGSVNYIEVANYYTSQGRPPFNVAYKKSADTSFVSAGETTNGITITGIEAHVNYDVRVTDKCGAVSYTTARLEMGAGNEVNVPATTCSNGQITINPSTDDRYKGIAPYKYAVFKQNEPYNDSAFISNNVFTGLGKATYKYYIKDACGGGAGPVIFSLGEGTPSGNATETIATNSCNRTITIHADPNKGTRPLTYALRAFTDPSFTYQTDSVFNVSLAFPGNTYYYHIISACGDTSLRQTLFVTRDNPHVDSVTYLGNTCVVKDFTVHVTGGNAPYQYGFYNTDSGNYIFQASDTIRNLPNNPGYNQYIQVKDRCGRVADFWLPSPCGIFTTTGDYESKNYLPVCPDFLGSNWIDVKDYAGKLIYSINPNGNTMNSVCWGVHVEPISQSLRSDLLNGKLTHFLNRNFYIEPSANLILTDSVSLRIYFTDAEMQHMLAVLYDIYGILYTPDDLKILKKKGSPGSPADLNVTNDAIASPGQFIVIHPTVFRYGNNWGMEFKVNDFSEFNSYIGELETLPLNFISFTANQQKDAVQLKWTTASEVNASQFEVQWSTSGNIFNTIGKVPSNNRNVNDYVFNHLKPATAINYYRLKQIDKDGKYTFSKVIKVPFTNKESITIYPNPAHEKLTIQLPGGQALKSAKVFDASGRQVLQKNIRPSVVQMELDIHTLAKGWYMLQFEGTAQQPISFIKN